MDDIVMMLQKVSRDNMEASVPTDIVVGEVISTEPLRISLDQKLILEGNQILLTRNLTDYELDMTVDHKTENKAYSSVNPDAFANHNHDYVGRKTFFIHNALQLNDKVLMVRNKGGQLYVAIDKVVNV